MTILPFLRIGTLLAALAFMTLNGAAAQDAQRMAQSDQTAEEALRDVGRILEGRNVIRQQPAPGADAVPAEEVPGAGEQPAPQSQVPLLPTEAEPVPGRLFARLTEDTGALGSNVRWRVYAARPAPDGSHATVAASDEAQPVITVPPGEYVAVAVFGHAVGTKRFEVAEEAFREGITLNAGALRISSRLIDGQLIPSKLVTLQVFGVDVDEFGQRKLVVEEVRPGSVVALNIGSYHIVSQYGDANSTVRDDVKIEAAQLTDASITHAAAPITLKLVNEPGGEALANTAWSILSPGGDIVKESFGAFPTHVLAAGDYSVIARHEGQIYNRDFTVQAGVAAEVEVVAKN